MKIKIGKHKKADISNIWVAIICIFVLEVLALAKGINGNLLRIVIAAIAGLAGLATPAPLIFQKIKELRKNG